MEKCYSPSRTAIFSRNSVIFLCFCFLLFYYTAEDDVMLNKSQQVLSFDISSTSSHGSNTARERYDRYELWICVRVRGSQYWVNAPNWCHPNPALHACCTKLGADLRESPNRSLIELLLWGIVSTVEEVVFFLRRIASIHSAFAFATDAHLLLYFKFFVAFLGLLYTKNLDILGYRTNMQTIGNFYAPHTRAEASPPSPTSTMIGCDSQLFADYYGKNEVCVILGLWSPR